MVNAEKTVVQSDSEVHGRLEIDTRNFKIGLLKIAYEFGVDRIPGYIECRDAKEIARILRGGLFEEVERYVNIGDGLDRRIMLPFSDILGYDGVKHYLVLIGSDVDMLCFVHLHNLFTVGVTLSTERFGKHFEVGVNDVAKGSFRVWGPEDIPASTKYRPLLHFETEVEVTEFREAEHAADFDYESIDGMWQLFTRDGRDTGRNIQHVVETLVPARTECVSGGLTEEFWFDEEVYLRRARSGESVRVLAFRAEHTWQKL